MLSLLLFTSTAPFSHPVLSKMWLHHSLRERLAFSWHPGTEQKQRIKMFCDTFSASMLKEFGYVWGDELIPAYFPFSKLL